MRTLGKADAGLDQVSTQTIPEVNQLIQDLRQMAIALQSVAEKVDRGGAGSLIGGIAETQEMLDFCGAHNIVPDAVELLGTLRTLKTSGGDYVWSPSVQPGTPATLLGYPVIEAEDMPTIAANSLSVAFGDFRRGYLVVDRTGMRVLRDPYSAKPYVLFYTTKRVGGGVQDFDAIKLLKFS